MVLTIAGQTRAARRTVTVKAGALAGERMRRPRWNRRGDPWEVDVAGDDGAWTFDVHSVSRIAADPVDDDGERIFAIVFEAKGPGAEGEIEIYVEDVPDPSQIITMAMANLHDALAAWARITAGRRIANDDGGLQGETPQ